MNNIKVCFCEHDPALRKKINNYFCNENRFAVQVCGEEDFAIPADGCEIGIVDVSMAGYRAMYNELKNVGAKIVLCCDDESQYPRLNADAVLLRPYSLNDVNAVIYSLLPSEERFHLASNKIMDEKLSNIFIRAGIPPHIKGYQYLRTAVKIAISQPDVVNSITKRLYPAVAQHYATTASKVERAIRHAIEVAWNRGKIENINAIFGVKIYTRADKPTNGELIALIADKMVIEMM